MQCEFHYITLIIRYVTLSLQCESAFTLVNLLSSVLTAIFVSTDLAIILRRINNCNNN